MGEISERKKPLDVSVCPFLVRHLVPAKDAYHVHCSRPVFLLPVALSAVAPASYTLASRVSWHCCHHLDHVLLHTLLFNSTEY